MILSGIDIARLKPKAQAGLRLLYQAYPAAVPLQDMADACGFGGYRMRISEMRRILRPVGYDIRQYYAPTRDDGFKPSFYVLEKLCKNLDICPNPIQDNSCEQFALL